MGIDWIPRSAPDFAIWLKNFANQLAIHGAGLDVTPAEITRVADHNVRFAGKVADTRTAKNAWHAQVAGRNSDQKGVIFPDVREIGQRIQHHPNMTDATRALLGLAMRDTEPSPPPPTGPTWPVGMVDMSERLIHKLRWRDRLSGRAAKPPGVREAEIRLAVTDQGAAIPPLNQFVFLRRVSDSSWRTEFAPAQAGKVAHYILRWISRDGSEGSWSETVSVTIAG
jgi:hypothetical protein